MSVRDLVSAAVANGLSSSMRSRAFRKSGLSFRRTHGETTQLLSLQLSQANTGSEGGFYINVGIAFDAVTAMEGDRSAALLVGGERVHFHERLRQAALSTDAECWLVTADTDPVVLAEGISSVVMPVLQRLDAVTSPATMLQVFPLAPSILRAQLRLLTGQDDLALQDVRFVADSFAGRDGMSFDDIVLRHGLERLIELV